MTFLREIVEGIEVGTGAGSVVLPLAFTVRELLLMRRAEDHEGETGCTATYDE